MRITDIGKRLEQRKGQLLGTQKALQSKQQEFKKHKTDLFLWQQARVFLQVTAKETQQELEYRFSELLTLAMDGVFEQDAYAVELKFELRRNTTEVDIWFIREGNRIKPLASGGLGAADVGALGFLFTLLASQVPQSRPIALLDEPLKHLKGEIANENALRMINEISKQLTLSNGTKGLQIIMVSDERVSREMILENADKVFEISISNAKSHVKVIE